MNIALLTCQRLPDLFETDQALIPLFAAQGMDAKPVIWNDADVDWTKFDALVIRNTWDYYTQHQAFIAWLEEIRDKRVCMLNPAKVVLQNLHKFYLREFESNGVTIIPTIFSSSASPATVDMIRSRGWRQVVIKPAISAGSYLTSTYDVDSLSSTLLGDILGKGDWLIQPFMPEISEGELSMIFFKREFSHAVVKKPKEGDFRVQRQYGGLYQRVNPGEDLITVARKIISNIDQTLLYARVDGVMIDKKFHLMELELIEPDLYFEFGDDIKTRFVDAAVSLIEAMDKA